MSEKEYIFVGNAQNKTRDYIKQLEKENREKDTEIERLTKRLREAQLGYLAVEEKNKKLHSIIKEVREYIKKKSMIVKLGNKMEFAIDLYLKEPEYKELLEILDKEDEE